MGRRRVRTGLTMFGIAIGVFALTVMGAMSENFATQIDNAQRLYSQVIQIRQAKQGLDGRFTTVTVAHIQQVDGVLGVANILGAPLADTGDSGISFSEPAQVIGVDPYFIEYVFGTVHLKGGRWLDGSDNRATVLGSKVAASHHLGPGGTLTWRNHDYTVVGVMGDTNSFPDQYALMPFDTVQRDLNFPPSVIGELQVIAQPNADP